MHRAYKFLLCFFLILWVFECKKEQDVEPNPVIEEKPAWLSGPEQEKLGDEIFYVREESGESSFLKRKLDPRDIAIKRMLPIAKEIRDNIQKKNFRALVAKADSTITSLIGRSNGVENTPKYEETIINLWVEKYTQNGNKDPYCNLDLILNSEIKRIEIQPYLAKDPFIGKNKVAYTAEYILKFFDSQNKEMVLRFHIDFFNTDELTKPVFYLLRSFWDHCPDPNLYELPMPKQEVY